MVEDRSLPSRPSLKFTSRRSGLALLFPAFFIVIAIMIASDAETFKPGSHLGGGVAAFAIIGCVLLVAATRRWTAEINPATQRLTIYRQFLGGRTKAVVDCPFDDCSKLGTIRYDTDGHLSYGVYVEFKRGGRNAIPLQDSTFQEASRVASELSAVTGIPRVDTMY